MNLRPTPSCCEFKYFDPLILPDKQGDFTTLFPKHSLGNATSIDLLTAFAPIVNGTI